MAKNLLSLLFCISLPYLIYTSGTYYQLIVPHSFNFRNKNSLSNLNNYQLNGDTSVSESSITLVPSRNNTYGSFISKENLNTTRFEMQVSFKLSHFPNQGSFISFWFIDNPTETSITLNSKFNGFGIVLASEPSDKKSSRATVRVVQTFANETIKNSIVKYFDQDFEANIKDMPNRFCFDFFTNVNQQLYLKYDTGSIRVNYNDPKETAYTHCLTAFMKPYKTGNFKLGVFAYNGRNFIVDKAFNPKDTNFDIISTVELSKITLFNMDRNYIPNFEYNIEGRPSKTNDESKNEYDVNIVDKAKITIESMIAYLKNMNVKMEKQLKSKGVKHDPTFYEKIFEKMEDYTKIVLDQLKEVLNLKTQEDKKKTSLNDLFEQWLSIKDKIPEQKNHKFADEIKAKLSQVEKDIAKLREIQRNITIKNQEGRTEDL